MDYLHLAIKAGIEAGRMIMEVYNTSFTVELKDDRSPLTKADKESHRVIMEFLKNTGIPILSEEGKSIPYSERKKWKKFWLVDPLDGTKEFIKHNGEFTVNIALIEDQTPVMGIIYAPVLKELYFSAIEIGAFKLEDIDPDDHEITDVIRTSTKINVRGEAEPYNVVASRSHFSPETEQYVEILKRDHPALSYVSKGSSLKLCLVAEGKANVYPRLGPTMEWDTGAGHAIVLGAGGSVVDFETGKPLKYNKAELLNPYFIAR